jgi:MYXO-CTERM domain-containing protein
MLWGVSGFLAALLATAPAYAGCGDGVWEEDEPCDDGNDVPNDACNQCRLSCEEVAASLTTHTCGHGRNGPFVSAGAQSYPGFVYTDISPSHTYFTLTLSGESGQNRSAVLYAPGSDGPYPFYLKEPYPLSVFSSAGEEVPLLFEHGVSCGQAGAGSDSLKWVKVYELLRSEMYTIVFGPTDSTTVSVAIEAMAPPAAAFWDRDGDAHGGALAGIDGCEYEAATVATADDDATIHPGAAESYDGVDNDCSGEEDAGGAGAGGSGDAGEASSAGAPTTSDGGTSAGGSGRNAGASAGGEPSDPGRHVAPASDSGCSCRSARGGPWSAGLGLLAALALGALRLRRKA